MLEIDPKYPCLVFYLKIVYKRMKLKKDKFLLIFDSMYVRVLNKWIKITY